MDSAIIISFFADGAIIPIVLIAAYALLVKVPPSERLESYSRILMAGLTAYLVAKLLGSVYQPSLERPFELLGQQAGASYLNNPGFPSDHALFAAFLTFAVWFEARQKKLAIALIILTILVCIARVLALVHTPLDVIGGVSVALIGACWYMRAARSKKKEIL